MRASQDSADGASQHIDLTAKASQPKWTSSWRKGMVNGKTLPADAAPAIDVSDPQGGEASAASVANEASVPIEIMNLQTGETMFTGEVHAPRGPEAEEAAALAAAVQASLVTAPRAPEAKQPAEAEAEQLAAPVDEPAHEAVVAPPHDDGEAAASENKENDSVGMVKATGAPNASGAASATSAPVRVPYRANLLTRVLRNCFEDDAHRTAIVAAVAPGAESVIHTLNTLDHVVLMAPHLRHASCEVDVPMLGARGERFTYEDTPVHEWSPEQVLEWLGNVDGGRFSQVVVPKGTDGKDLLRLNARRLTELVETENVEGRADGEGWYVSQQARVGRALFGALRDAQRKNGIRRRE